ncbi:MAG: hypothetical protein AAGA81_06100 [Acidobacteriota bacterium]
MRCELAWLPRYRVLVATDDGPSWEVWICGLEGALCARPGSVTDSPGPPGSSEAPAAAASALKPSWRLDERAAASFARSHLVRSAQVLRLAAGLAEEDPTVERWRFPVHLEIYRRRGLRRSWALRADDAVVGEVLSALQRRALLQELLEAPPK